jgi:glycosyltransferase involved in cell wall biosynthesis
LFTRFFDRVIVVSVEMQSKLTGIQSEVIPCGVDLQMFYPRDREECRAQLGLSPDRRLVLWAGEKERPEKRYELIPPAIELLREEFPDAELITLSGKPHSLVPLYMNACDVLVLTSDAEGSPMVIKEAMACNLPVVSTPVGDVAEVIHGVEGCYLTTYQPARIAHDLARALAFAGKTEGRLKMASYELDQIGRRVIDVYSDLLESRGKRESVPVGGPS